MAKKKKQSALDLINYMPDKYGPHEGINNDTGPRDAVDQLVKSFHEINDVISDHANLMLISIKRALTIYNYTEKQLLAEFNKHFPHNPYKSMKEVIEHYQTIAV